MPDRKELSLRDRLILEVMALFLSFTHHRHNDPLRKWTTIIFFVTWSVSTVLLFTEYGVEAWSYWLMTFMVAYILGRQHEAEFTKLLR